MAVVGIDDTDSRERGMCTTYVATAVGRRLASSGAAVERRVLLRCNPAVPHKTRGNAAVALHVDAGDSSLDAVLEIVRETVAEFAETADPDTNPGVVVAPGAPEDVPDAVATFARHAVHDRHAIEDAVALAEDSGYRTAAWGNGRGRIGALAAVGAWRATDEWTVERIAYREAERWGEARRVDDQSVWAAAEEHYPRVWDTVDRTAGEIVCVPHTPGPVLYGVRGDDVASVSAVAELIEGEPVARAATFYTNQGTDAHLRPGTIGALRDGRAYRVDGVVTEPPETRAGGHVFFAMGPTEESGAGAEGAESSGAATLSCVAFEPTKRFRDRVRDLREGDRITACGEVADGTLKLEKFALRDRVETESVTPTCDACDRRMESAGADQGYRCRDCEATADGSATRDLDRSLSPGWYEVPPVARRHVAKPLVRGGFDAPTYPER